MTQNSKIFKKQKKKKTNKQARDITILDMCTKNYDHMIYGSWDMVSWRTDRQKKWYIEVGAPTKKGEYSSLTPTKAFVRIISSSQ